MATLLSLPADHPPCDDTSPTVAVVILSWNSLSDTLECLQSVAAMSYKPARTYLVDNGSTDGSIEIVRQLYPSVRLCRIEANLGVPSGYNVGIQAALADGADYVFILNNDTVLAEDMLGLLIKAAQQNPQCGVFMPLVLYYNSPEVLWSAGARYRRFPPAIVLIGRGRPADRRDAPREIPYAPACGLLIRRETFARVGLFASEYFFFYEDWDLCERIRATGLKILLVPSARMWHKVSRSTRRFSDVYWRTWGESSARFYRRFGGPAPVSLVVHLGYLAVRELVKGNIWFLPMFFRGVRDGLRDKPPMPIDE